MSGLKLYIADEQKLAKYDLPEEIQESFLISYKPSNSKREYTINIEASEDKWFLKSNGLVNIIQNENIVMEAPLSYYCFYQLEIANDKSKKYLYCLPKYNENFSNISIFGLSNITIGNASNCNIYYQRQGVVGQHILIQNSNDKWLLTANGTGVFVNGRVIKQIYLKTGDVIFLNGLKIIFMDNFLRLNNPNNMVAINGLQYYNDSSQTDYTNYEKVNTDEIGYELYDSSQYFYHIPRIINGYDEEEVIIDSPPEEEKEQHTPFILSLGSSLTMAASSFMMGFSVVNGLSTGTRKFIDVLPQLVMCIAMIFGSIVMPKITTAYTNKLRRKREKLRQEKYSEYLKYKEQEINEILEKQITILKLNYPTQRDCINLIMNKDKRLWERQINDKDFLSLSVGLGKRQASIKITAPEKKFTLDEDGLQEKVFSLVNKSKDLNDAPITYSLIKRRFSAIICNSKTRNLYINSLILQLITMHSATDLKLAFLIDDDEQFDYAKYLPHTWSEDKKNRYFASDITDIKQVSELLLKEIKEREQTLDPTGKKGKLWEEDTYKKFSTYYLIITDSYKRIKDVPIINKILSSEGNIGFSILFLEDTIVDLPPQCKTFSYILDSGNYILEPGEEYSRTQQFKNPEILNIDMNLIASKLLNIPIPAKTGAAVLPKSITFLEMYNVSKIEQLNILNRWKTNDPVTNLNTPIGVHADRELFMLDLHEKAHGPHGLIAGSTGSGKSEFIITFVLSMAINFHPNEVQFVLIDYKGGGLAGAFENREKGISLPHLAGTITNLDTAEINRTLVSINSELKRRQAKFNTERDRLGEGTIDIYKYQKLYREGKIKEPIAHLFLIADEFAELKSQQPEFMDELISTARIGRSLGVHLILATQKPSGVVNDQIWANSKFKICLKVQDRGDSMEMIKKPDAASIKETGRFYLQVGYDEYFDIGQSGWSGADYVPSDRVMKKVDDSLNCINSIGKVIKTIIEEKSKDSENSKQKLGDQLTNIVKYIVDISKKQKIKTKKLWLSSIPDVIRLDGIVEKYDYEEKPYVIRPAIGEYDNPSAQTQGLLTIDFTNIGHLVVYGMAGSGKENLLTTLIYSTCINHTPDEVNFYIFDYGAETLKIFSKYPHVGCVTTVDEQEQMMDTLVMIDKEADRRKSLFTEYGGSYRNYIKESGNKLPLIMVVINYYEVFLESNSRLADALQGLIREGSKYGIIFIVTTSVNNSMGVRVSQLFLNKISLQQPDESTYRSLLNTPKGLYPKKYFGRGLALYNEHFYEFQTAYICEKDKVNKQIRQTAAILLEKYKIRAKSAIKLPDVVTFDMLREKVDGINKIPIGYSNDEKNVYYYDFSKFSTVPVLSKNINDKNLFISAIAKEFSELNNVEVTIIDAINIINNHIENVNVLKDNFDAGLIEMIKGINKESDEKLRIYLIVGFNEFKNSLNNDYISYFNLLMTEIHKFKSSKILLFDSYDEFKNLEIEDWFEDTINKDSSIWLGSGVADQVLLNFDGLTEENSRETFDYIGFASQNAVASVIRYVIDKGEDS